MKTRTNKTVENVPELKPKDSPENTTTTATVEKNVNSTKKVELRAVGNIIGEKRNSISPKSVKIITTKKRKKCARTKAEGFS